MIVIGLKIQGFRKITAVEMEFATSGLTPIKGKNQQGKTTILDSISALFTGKKGIPKDAIQHGKKRATISAQLTDGKDTYVIERVIKDNGQTALKVLKNDGIKVGKPETFVKSLINQLSFDPRPFLDKNDEDKLKFLMEVLDLDFTEIDERHNKLYSDRRDLGRDIKAIGTLTPVEKTDPVDVQDILVQKREITEFNEKERTRVSEVNARVTAWETKKATVVEKITNLEKEEEELNAKLAVVQEKLATGRKYLQDFPPIGTKVDPDLKSVDELDEQLANASAINQKAADYTRYVEDLKGKKLKQDKYDELTEAIQTCKDEKKQMLLEVKMPVQKLSIHLGEEGTEDGVYYGDTHSANWSESEAMRISSELCLAMQPELRAIFIDRGEAYDSDSLKELEAWAKKNKIQAIITIVDNIPEELEEGVFYIEDGNIITK